MSNSTSITMFEDVVLLDIDSVSPVWDTYSFYINIASPGTKFIQNKIDSLDTIDSIIEVDQVANKMDQAADNSLLTDVKTIIANIKTEELEYDSVASLPASIYMVSLCNVLTSPWHYSVWSFDEEDIAMKVAKRKRLFNEIKEWGRKQSRL
ncbi:hypothetical protein EDD22DRAFT_849179 [Suillus occidentalis]|nr:hypothetical protein EDD22DRAFT_849179 [Suillus occidentalis]